MEAIRESVAFTLRGGAIDRGSGKDDAYFSGWMESQGVEPFYYRHMPEETLHLSFLATIERKVSSYGIDMLRVQMAGTYGRFNEPDVGSGRSSTGWDRLPNFITSSALIRVLGAMEQYELDVLKALLYYRPSGKQRLVDLPFVDADLSVVTERPDTEGRYAMPALWSWLKKPAENSVERRKIYKNVFDIDCYPREFGSMNSKDIKSFYQDIYERRNAIAHGRELVDVTLEDYCKAEAFALALFFHLSTICVEKYALGV